MNSTEVGTSTNNSSIQEARADLRVSFLESLSALKGFEAEFRLHEGTRVFGRLEAFDRDVLLLHVTDLRTPLATYGRATLRATDVVSMRVQLPTHQCA